jgi:hypothetical protein
MDVVIQCASTKDPSAGTLRTKGGKAVHFVAAPHLCSPTAETIYARPDDESDHQGQSWRNRLEAYVAHDADNSLGMRQAYLLYKHSAYGRLVEHFGISRVFILSAGWGLVRADYLLPAYDVTFNQRAKQKNPAAYSTSIEGWSFFQQLPKNDKEPVVFLGGRDYLPLFERLTLSLQRKRIVFVRAAEAGSVRRSPGSFSCELREFHVAARTNWHYQCAAALATGELEV